MSVAATAQTENEKLPEILTLEHALSLADQAHPQLKLSEAELLAAQAEQADVDTKSDFQAYLEGRLRYVEPSRIAFDQSNNDSRFGISISKDLYDFGFQEARSKAAQSEVAASQFAFLDTRAHRRMAIVQQFFDVLLADLQFSRYNEEMAVEYVSFDRLRHRKELGQVSDYEVKQQESRFQRIRYRQIEAQNEQRRSRAILAETLNRPGQLPAELAKPEVASLKRELPEYEQLLALALEHNYKLKTLYAKLEAAEQQVAAARASENPSLVGEVEAYDYAKEMGSYDKFRAGVTLKVPLFGGSRTDAKTAKAQARLYSIKAQLEDTQGQIRQRVLDTWLELQALKARQQEMKILREYRELNLDRSRALYEMEVKTDLGDAMAQISEAEYLSAQTDYKMAAAWLRLDILTGQLKLAQENSNP